MGPQTQGPEALLGQHIAGYRLERVLGVGATGAVYLGQRLLDQPRLVEQVGGSPVAYPDEAALKLLYVPWQLSAEESADFRARFQREAETLRQLDHPHILPIIGSGEDAATGMLYMLLPYHATTLAAKLAAAGGRLPLDECAALLTQLADALDYAHSRGVVHRDIKPANILLDGAGQVYLADFGILRLLDPARTKLTSTGQTMGTPEYMAPEQAQGADVGPAADRYSLGVVLYQMVTGQVPFAGTSAVQVAMRVVQEAPTSPRQLRSELPESAAIVMLKALAKRPEDRFGFSSELAQAFALGLAGQSLPNVVTPIAPGVTAPIPFYPPPVAGVGSVTMPQQTPLPAVFPGERTAASRAPRRTGLIALLSVGITLLVVAGLLLAVTQNAFGLRDALANRGIALGSSTPGQPTATQVSFNPTNTAIPGEVTPTITGTGTVNSPTPARATATSTLVSATSTTQPPAPTATPGQTGPQSGTLVWRYQTGAGVASRVAYSNGVVYFGSDDGYLYALNATNGNFIWSYQTGGKVNSGPALVNGVLYFGSWDTYFYALRASDGTLVWRYQTGSVISNSSPSVINGVAYFGGWDDYIYALNTSDGSLRWRYQTGSNVISSPAVVNGVVYIGSLDDYLYAIDASSGSLVWRYQTGGSVASGPSVANGVVYVGSSDHYAYALHTADGSLVWRYQMSAAGSSSTVLANGVAYFGSNNGNFYALNADTGAPIWDYQAAGGIEALPVVSSGALYFGASIYINAVNASSGKLDWRHPTGTTAWGSANVVNGIVYCGSADAYLYALIA